MEYVCFQCKHRWISKVIPRQCPKCWSRSIERDVEIKLACVSLKPWAYLLINRPTPIPLPHDLESFPASLSAFASIMAQTQGNITARANALSLLFIDAGLSEALAKNIIANFR
ncbi:hypothetical protein KA005_47590 [bacterium]|nr:hypothetical protein [bacterium]